MRRDFFRVEKHPKQDKSWTSSKGKTIPLLKKLEEAKKYVENLILYKNN